MLKEKRCNKTKWSRFNLQSSKNELGTAQSQYCAAQAENLRTRCLIAENAIVRSVFDEHKIQGSVMRNSLDTTRKAFEETELRTPFAGIAADIETEQFENVISNTSMSVLLTAKSLPDRLETLVM